MQIEGRATAKNHIYVILMIFVVFFICLSPNLYSQNTSTNKNSFTLKKNSQGEVGIDVSGVGLASVDQGYPVVIEIYENDSVIKKIASGYTSSKATESGVEGRVEIKVSETATIVVSDSWSWAEGVLGLARKLEVKGEDKRAFMSGIILTTKNKVARAEVDYFVPGMIYGSTDNITVSAIGGRDTFESGGGRIWIREDRMPAPLLAVRFKDNSSIAVLDPAPDGRTTKEDSHDIESVTLVDERFRFGAVGAEYIDDKLACGFWFPGTEGEITYKGNTYPDGQMKKWRRRYHPLKDGLTQKYRVMFRFGAEQSLSDLYKDSWRWAWERLEPPVKKNNIDLARTCLIKMLAEEVIVYKDRAGIPNYVSCSPMDPVYVRDNHAVFGFTGKNLESAYFLLRGSYESKFPQRDKLRELGRQIIDSFCVLKMNPPAGEGFHIFSGEPVLAIRHLRHGPKGAYLRSLGDGMKTATRAYLLERQHGREHKEWLDWLVSFGDWLLTKQNFDGSFPRKFAAGSGEVMDPSPTTSYNVVPFLVLLSEASGAEKYLKGAIKAAEYAWAEGQKNGIFIGGTIDNPNVIDKEAGTLSLEGYLILYEKTRDDKWLERAKIAGNFAESWIYLWDVPMPEDEDNSKLHWKKGVSTIGLQLISTGHSLVDEYMAFDADEYAKLWSYTKDPHYYEVALILLHNTKNMMAVPGRNYDLNGPGWQQEHWSLAPLRGFGLHRGWLPWVTCSHLNGIYGIMDFDSELYKMLIRGIKPF